MRPILRTTNLALVESARFALEAEEIPALTSNAYAAGLPFNLVTVAILRDADFERAVAIVGELQADPGGVAAVAVAADARPYPPRRRVQQFGVALLVLMALIGFFQLIS